MLSCIIRCSFRRAVSAAIPTTTARRPRGRPRGSTNKSSSKTPVVTPTRPRSHRASAVAASAAIADTVADGANGADDGTHGDDSDDEVAIVVDDEGNPGGVETLVGNEEVELSSDNRYSLKLAAAKLHIESLLGQQVVKRFNGPQSGNITWTVVADHEVERMPERPLSEIGYAWEKVPYDPSDEFLFAKMFLDLFFDDWVIALAVMNSIISESNTQYSQKTFDREEFCKALSCFIGAACTSQRGYKLFEANPTRDLNIVVINGKEYVTIEQMPNFRQKMSLSKWKLFVKFFPLIWNDKTEEHVDAWWRIRPLIKDFNRNRRRLIKPGNILVYDESIIPFRPQTRSTGNIPHLSYIPDKPAELGPEMKVLMCALIGCKMMIELMEGKMGMSTKRHSRQLGVTVALCLRMHEEW